MQESHPAGPDENFNSESLAADVRVRLQQHWCLPVSQKPWPTASGEQTLWPARSGHVEPAYCLPLQPELWQKSESHLVSAQNHTM